jgi:hypothetical protein
MNTPSAVYIFYVKSHKQSAYLLTASACRFKCCRTKLIAMNFVLQGQRWPQHAHEYADLVRKA